MHIMSNRQSPKANEYLFLWCDGVLTVRGKCKTSNGATGTNPPVLSLSHTLSIFLKYFFNFILFFTFIKTANLVVMLNLFKTFFFNFDH